MNNNDLFLLAKKSRVQLLELAIKSDGPSHLVGGLSMVEIFTVLYGIILKYDPGNPEWENRDRFILSKGHACVAVYAALAEVGFIKKDDLLTYGEDFSNLMNHISHKVPGVEFSTGSLGHGLPFGVGKALAAKRLGADWRTFVLLSDGELGEGSNWEAMMFAGHHKLDNLIAIVDYNKLQSLTTVKNTLNIEPLLAKFQAFGWSVKEVDGHNCAALKESLFFLPWTTKKPSILIANTIKGKGVRWMENKVEWHYKTPSSEQLRIALNELENA